MGLAIRNVRGIPMRVEVKLAQKVAFKRAFLGMPARYLCITQVSTKTMGAKAIHIRGHCRARRGIIRLPQAA